MNLLRNSRTMATYKIGKKRGTNTHSFINNAYTITIPLLGRMHKIHLSYKSIKEPSIHMENSNIEVVLPNKYKKMEVTQILKILTDKLYDKIAQQEVEIVMEKTRLMLGFAPEDYCIMRSNTNSIATCLNGEKKIIIQPEIAKYDKKSIEYIILHEFCHLKYKVHSKGFWNMLEKYMPNYKQYNLEFSI